MFLYPPTKKQGMKRGVLVRLFLMVAAVCVFAASVSALNASVGTYKKLAGENWTVDGFDMSIIQREEIDEDFIYVRFGNITQDMHLHDCTHFYNYQVCFTNTTLEAAFNKTLKTTPYTYWLKITADLAKVAITTTVEPKVLFVGETTDVAIGVRNTGSIAITDLDFTVNTAGFEVETLRGPCVATDSTLAYTGMLRVDELFTCDLTMRSLNATKLVLRGIANFTDGRKRVVTLGPGLTIESKGSPMWLSFANATGRVGQRVRGTINLNNTFGQSTTTLKGTLSAPLPLNGTIVFDETLGAGKSTSTAFTMNLTRSGNHTLRIKGMRSALSETASIDYTTVFRVLPPRVTLKTFGRHTIQNGATASLILEVENGQDATLRNVSVRVSAQNLTLPPGGFTTDLALGENEEFYSQEFGVPSNDTTVAVLVELSYASEYGEQFTQEDNVTITVGTPSRRPVPPARTPTPPKNVTQTAPPVTQKTASPTNVSQKEPPLFSPTVANIVLAATIAGILVGCVAWLLSQRGKPPVNQNDVYEEEES